MNKKFIEWLYRELPDLTSKGVLSAESAERLRKYYGEVEGIGPRRVALTICSILGAVLVGSGIILLLAHNWENLSRPVRIVLSLGPLLVAQSLAAWTILRQRETAGWREGTATFLMIAIGASIALIGQTYHVPGDMAGFLLTWMLLSVPLVYLTGASVPAALYLAGITAWAAYTKSSYPDIGGAGHTFLFWPLAALIVPHYWQVGRRNVYGVRQALLFCAASICVCVATGITLEREVPGLWIITYVSLFAVMYLAGSLWFGQAPTTWQGPFQSVGAAGLCVLSYMLTFEWLWEDILGEGYWQGWTYRAFTPAHDYLLTGTLLIGALALLVISVRKRRSLQILFGAAPVMAVIGFALTALLQHIAWPGRLLFNAYMFALGVGTMSVGIRSGGMGTTNAGMLLVAALIVTRFFDIDVSFVTRGLVFIVVGMGFLGTNMLLSRRRKGGAQ